MNNDKKPVVEKPLRLTPKFWTVAIGTGVAASLGVVIVSQTLTLPHNAKDASLLTPQEEIVARKEATTALFNMIQSHCVQEVIRLAMPQSELKSSFSKIDSDKSYYAASNRAKKIIGPKRFESIYSNAYSEIPLLDGQDFTTYLTVSVQSDSQNLTQEDLAFTIDRQGNTQLTRDETNPVRYPEEHIIDYEHNVKARADIIKQNYGLCVKQTFAETLFPF